MKHYLIKVQKFLITEAGVTAIEYALIAALLSIAFIVSAVLLGVNLGDLYNRVAICITTTGCSAIS